MFYIYFIFIHIEAQELFCRQNLSGDINFLFLNSLLYDKKKKKTLALDVIVFIVHNTGRHEIFRVMFKNNEELKLRGSDPCSAFLKLSSACKVLNNCLRCPNSFSKEATPYLSQLSSSHIKQ